jgi:two-component system cell cycle sensor histidine kinase/response regulator CckA
MNAELAAVDTTVSDAVQTGFQQIRLAAETAAQLTRQLLLFSRNQAMQASNLDLNDVVTNLAKMLRRIIGEDISLQLHLNSQPLFVHADPGMLDQVLLNLAVNARDAMLQGGKLLVETREVMVDDAFARLNHEAKPGRYVCLDVADTGAGIPPEVLPRIFEPFFTTKEKGKGTGLGLATVFGIVKQHSGFIKVESEPNQGAHFQIFLPAIAAPVPIAKSVNQSKVCRGTETVLLVEDEELLRTLARTVLERNGYSVVEAANGVEALNLWDQCRERVQLLLTDVVMPAGVSGYQLANVLQHDKPRLKVLFVSGYSPQTAHWKGELKVGENFLNKPFSPDRLLETVRQRLDAR